MNQAVVLEKECVFFLRSGCVCLPRFFLLSSFVYTPQSPLGIFSFLFLGMGGGGGGGRGGVVGGEIKMQCLSSHSQLMKSSSFSSHYL